MLGHSTDTDLADGPPSTRWCRTAAVMPPRSSPPGTSRTGRTTTIPTSGFAIGDRQYLSYMSVRRWGVVPGMWYTNYVHRLLRRRRPAPGPRISMPSGTTSSNRTLPGDGEVFPQGDHVYMFGTPQRAARGAVGLARVPIDKLLNPSAYQYWVSGSWVPVIEHLATPGARAGAASELSVALRTPPRS
ncbi:DUF4185 domain-containing protein, partial [Rhodococcus hoagii]|nr:DUF4185 domain-containing protein [Prescottella equi]